MREIIVLLDSSFSHTELDLKKKGNRINWSLRFSFYPADMVYIQYMNELIQIGDFTLITRG